MISIKLNDKRIEVNPNTSLDVLLDKINQPSNGIAIAINQTVVAKSNWNSTFLKPDDSVLLIKATQGG